MSLAIRVRRSRHNLPHFSGPQTAQLSPRFKISLACIVRGRGVATCLEIHASVIKAAINNLDFLFLL